MRTEHDLLGEVLVEEGALHGAHTQRALENFTLAGRPVHPELIRAFGLVKLAALKTHRGLGCWSEDSAKADAMERAAHEIWERALVDVIAVDALQGGAGTSLNMAVNEVIANRALQILGEPLGAYHRVSPLDDINRGQSTNDTFPTALRVAAILGIRSLEESIVALAESCQVQEKALADVVKVGRTQLQDGVLTTLGRSFGAWADALNRDRWRVYKCEERLRVVNLGGTAIGTGLGASRKYIFRVVNVLRDLSGIGLARAENLVDGTQNQDALVEVSGILKALAATLIKISSDLRLLSSGPDAGLGEIRLPPVQAGSSVMPGKVNPVIPEAVTQAAIKVIANDAALTQALCLGSLELHPFLPLAADALLESLDLLTRSCRVLRTRCIEGITANRERCRSQVRGDTAVLTALVGQFGYDKADEVRKIAAERGMTVRQTVMDLGLLTDEAFEALIQPEAVCRLGSRGVC